MVKDLHENYNKIEYIESSNLQRLALFDLLIARLVIKNIIIKETGFISLMIIISNYFYITY